MPVAIAGTAQSYAYSLPRTITLAGSGSGGTIVAYRWFRLSRPIGSSAVLDDDEIAGPTYSHDVAGSCLWFLRVQDNEGNWSEANPLKAPSSAFLRVTVRSQSLDISYPATGQRNWADLLNDAISKLETPVGPMSSHIASGGSGKHTDSQITYSRPSGSRQNILAGDASVAAAINRLDDIIAALSGLTTTDKTSVVAALNEVKAHFTAAVETSAGAGDAGKLVKLKTGTGIIDATIHGAQAGGTLHADVISAGASGFMSGTDKSKLNGIENGADVTDEANVLAALADSAATKDVNNGKIVNVGTPENVGEAVALIAGSHGGPAIDGMWCPDGEQYIAIEDGETLAVGDVVEARNGTRCRKAASASTTVIGVCTEGGLGDTIGSVYARVKDRGIKALVVVNGGSTVVGKRVLLSATANHIEGATVMTGSFGIALQSVTGNGVLTCNVLLSPLGGLV